MVFPIEGENEKKKKEPNLRTIIALIMAMINKNEW